MAGWIKVHRDITKHWIFQDAEKFKWWMDLLIMASYEDDKLLVGDNLVTLKRGQLSVSLSFLSTRWRRSKETVLNFLKLLESDRMIERKSEKFSDLPATSSCTLGSSPMMVICERRAGWSGPLQSC